MQNVFRLLKSTRVICKKNVENLIQNVLRKDNLWTARKGIRTSIPINHNSHPYHILMIQIFL